MRLRGRTEVRYSETSRERGESQFLRVVVLIESLYKLKAFAVERKVECAAVARYARIGVRMLGKHGVEELLA